MVKNLLIFSMLFSNAYAQSIEYKYDSLNRIIQIAYPNESLIKYSYDLNGNRFLQTNSSLRCSLSEKTFQADTSNQNIVSYQWEVNDGSGFFNITDNEKYQGSATPSLQLMNAPTNWYGYQYRCKIILKDNSVAYNSLLSLTFVLHWKGSISDAWENPLNWSCGVVPDENTDVVIDSGVQRYPVIYNGGICRKLNTAAGVSVTVKDGKSLKITGK